jgi:DegV family protein with EDD domain
MNKEKIAVVVDSGCDVPLHLQKRYDIRVIPFRILIGDRQYNDGDITQEEICNILPRELPKTSLPSTEIVLRTLDEIKAEGYKRVFAVCISEGLSGTIGLIRLVCEEYSDLDCFVLDSKNISIGSGMLAIKAAMLIEEGISWESLCERMKNAVRSSKVFFCLDTLEYLYKGGRIGPVSALFGSALKLKPIISCNPEGVYYIASKTLGRKHAVDKMIKLALSYIDGCKKPLIAVMNTRAEHDAQYIKNVLAASMENFSTVAEGAISVMIDE